MSTGSQVSDHRTYQEVTNIRPDGTVVSTGVYRLVGDYFSKVWDGANQTGPGLDEHSYTMSRTSYDNPLVFIEERHPWGAPFNTRHTTIAQTDSFVVAPLPSGWSANDDLKLIGKMHDRAAQSSFHAGNFLAESGQVVSLFSETARRVASMLHHIRNGNLYKAANSVGVRISNGHVLSQNKYKTPGHYARAVSNAILELDFGWRPLISDVTEALEGFHDRMVVPYRQRYRCVRTRIVDDTLDKGYYTVFRRTKQSVQLRCVFSAPPSFNTTFNLNDPLGALWEVTPYSFVVDWALPVSDYIRAMHFLREFNLVSAWKSTLTTSSWVARDSSDPLYHVYWDSQPTGKTVTFVREPYALQTLSDLPVPVLKDIDKIASIRHMTDAVALLTQKANSFTRSIKF